METFVQQIRGELDAMAPSTNRRTPEQSHPHPDQLPPWAVKGLLWITGLILGSLVAGAFVAYPQIVRVMERNSILWEERAQQRSLNQ